MTPQPGGTRAKGNYGRDIQGEILQILEAGSATTIQILEQLPPPPLTPNAVRNNLHALRVKGKVHELEQKGRSIPWQLGPDQNHEDEV